MYKILQKKQLAGNIFQMTLEAPLIANARRAGQFVVLMDNSDLSERIPLTIAGADEKNGTIDIIFQTAGASTMALAKKEAGSSIWSLLGPLGRPTQIKKHAAPVVCAGGGIGAAPLLPIARAFKEAGCRVIVLLAARSKELLILEDAMRALADELIICTDDGSAGRRGLITEPLKEICARPEKPAEAVIVGPPAMMKFCAAVAQEYSVPAIASLNTIMIDGTGMCGGCRVSVGGQTRFVCVDGPEFDACQVDWDNMALRLKTYGAHEEVARQHVCRLQENLS